MSEMSDAVRGIRRLLARAWLYELLQVVVGSDASHRRFVAEHLRVEPGERLLDVGCGPGHILRALPERIDYLGLDSSADYVEAARREWGDRGEFRRVDVRAAEVPEGSFDVVMTMGVLHHLDDEGCASLLRLAARALKSGGRFVAIEPAFAEGQNSVARWLISRDRGAHVRSADQYARLARDVFRSVDVRVRSDLLRVPYTHAVLEAS